MELGTLQKHKSRYGAPIFFCGRHRVFTAFTIALIVAIWAFNDNKLITYPIKVIYIAYGLYLWARNGGAFSRYSAWCFVMLGFSVLGLGVASDIDVATYTFVNMLQVLLIAFVFFESVGDRDAILFLMKVIAFAGAILAVRLVVSTPVSSWLSYERLGTEIGYNANDVGDKAAVSMALSLGVVFWGQGKAKKPIYYAVAVAMLVIVLFSGSRKSLLFAIAVIGFMYTLGVSDLRKALFSSVLVIIALVFLYQVIMNDASLYQTIGRRVESMISALFQGGSEAGSIDLRERYALTAWNLFCGSPFLGIGLGNFSVVSGIGVYCHCDYLEVLCSYGLFGAIAFYTPMLVSIVRLIKLKEKTRIQYLLLIMCLMLAFNFATMVMYTSAYVQFLIIISLKYTSLSLVDDQKNSIEKLDE